MWPLNSPDLIMQCGEPCSSECIAIYDGLKPYAETRNHGRVVRAVWNVHWLQYQSAMCRPAQWHTYWTSFFWYAFSEVAYMAILLQFMRICKLLLSKGYVRQKLLDSVKAFERSKNVRWPHFLAHAVYRSSVQIYLNARKSLGGHSEKPWLSHIILFGM